MLIDTETFRTDTNTASDESAKCVKKVMTDPKSVSVSDRQAHAPSIRWI